MPDKLLIFSMLFVDSARCLQQHGQIRQYLPNKAAQIAAATNLLAGFECG